MLKRLLLLAIALALASAVPVHAQDSSTDTPLFSMERLSLGLSTDYCGFQNAGEQRLPDYAKSWEFGAVGAYTIVGPRPGAKVPILSLAFASAYDVDNKWFRHRLGLRLVVYKGGKY